MDATPAGEGLQPAAIQQATGERFAGASPRKPAGPAEVQEASDWFAVEPLAARVLEALEEEFWSGRHHRGRLLSAPLRIVIPHLPPQEHASRALLTGLAQWLESTPP